MEADKALEEVFISGDQMSGSSSSCKCLGGWGFEQSTGGGSRLGAKPSCYCGSKAVFRMAKTAKNKGKRFWGCPHFKGGSGEMGGCNFFQWCNEEACDERNLTIPDERSASARNDEVGGSIMKMEERDENLKYASLEKSVVILEKGMKVLIGMMFVTWVFNVILISMLMKVD